MPSIWDEVGKTEEEKKGTQTEEKPTDKTEPTNNNEGAKKEEPESQPEKTGSETSENNEEGKKEEAAPTITLRERVIERGRKEFPDDYGEGDFDDERYEGMVGKMFDKIDKDSSELVKLRENNKRLFAIFEEHPDVMQVFENLKGGMSLKKAMTDVYGSEYLNSEPDSDEEKEYMKAREEAAAKEKTIAENLKVSESEREKYYKEAGMTEDEIKAFEDAENAFWDTYGTGKFDKNYYSMIHNKITRDSDIKNAEEQGRINGRNEKIDEEKFSEKSDGIPTNEGGSGKTKKDKEKEEEYADEGARLFGGIAKRGTSIWG